MGFIDELSEDGTVTLDGSGNGSYTFPPPRGDTVWKITLLSVSTSTAVKQALAVVTTLRAGAATFIDGSFTGSADTSDTVHYIKPTQQLKVTWTGGDAGAVASVHIAGYQGDSVGRLASL